ncbi:MAG: ISL3 family transposase [Chloroflexi bacterium AL-W]|nr:ISL3 family transposase [Chloroflexi bacterium AL-N1]NOK65140.1 ISL3 family transposase [Chloroflexi bacterium AL-N10]NOK72593.1 ISL3 family transposase [Chloroflexi bacterium AL-N5]NOK79319.1 ISL3 family transposase [Chloroflexi bacterium AL-W]NOK87235.1 ISL3 family transposase [Chloroflexi bacterium AL-N15]
MLLDLERHCPIDLLPDRTAATLATWLQGHPTVQVITRDHALDYARGATDGAPQAIQVADRFHLLGHVRQTVERALLRLPPALRRHITVTESPSVPPIPAMEASPPPRYAPHPSLQRIQALRRTERAPRLSSGARTGGPGPDRTGVWALNHHCPPLVTNRNPPTRTTWLAGNGKH